MPERWEGKLCEAERGVMEKVWRLGLDIKMEYGLFRLVRDPDGISGMLITSNRRFRSLFKRVLDTSWYIVFEDAVGKGLFFAEWEDPAHRERLFRLILIELDNLGLVVTHFPKPIKETRSIVANEIVGMTPAVIEMVQTIEKAARTDRGTVLFLGPSGSGKESAARHLHIRSSRRDKPFVTVNCAAIPDTLIESELFGYEKGAFTGANTEKPGYFELANGGTIFLDEIGDLSLMAQAKILRVLATKKTQRIGGTRELNIDVRIVAATNKDLLGAVQGGTFREDLYYRLAVVDIFVPPLSQRREDIPLIVEHLLRVLKDEAGIAEEQKLSDEAMSCLMNYDWPGNIRELRNVLERAMILNSDVSELTAKCFPNLITVTQAGTKGVPKPPSYFIFDGDSVPNLDQVRREYLLALLARNKWNITQTAKDAGGVSRHTVRIWMNELGIKKPY